MGTAISRAVITAIGIIGGAVIVGVGIKQSLRLGRIVIIRETERPTPKDETIESVDLEAVMVDTFEGGIYKNSMAN